jgi:hypothetical protein
LNSDKIWKKYGRKASRIVKRFGQYGRKISWIVKRYGKYRRNPSWIVKWFRKYGTKVGWIVKWYGKLKYFITSCTRKASNVAFQTLQFEKSMGRWNVL